MTIVRGTNAFGPRQIERVMPTFSICALEGRPVPVYGEGRQRREFLYVTDWVRAALTVLDHGDRRWHLQHRRRVRAGEHRARAPHLRVGRRARVADRVRPRSPRPRLPIRPARGPTAGIGVGAAGVVRRRARADRRVVPRAPRVAPRRAPGPDRDGAPPGRCRRGEARRHRGRAAVSAGRSSRRCRRTIEVHAFSHADLDVGDRDAVMRTIPLAASRRGPELRRVHQRRRVRDGSGARDTRQRARRATRGARGAGVRRGGPARVDRLRLRRDEGCAVRRDGRDASAVRVRADEAGG